MANYGFLSLKRNPEMSLFGVLSIVLGFVIIYFLSYISKINENEEKIEEFKENLESQNLRIEADEKLLNTIKDIILLENIKKK